MVSLKEFVEGKENETKFYEIELHYAKNKDGDDKYRIFSHNGVLEDPEAGKIKNSNQKISNNKELKA